MNSDTIPDGTRVPPGAGISLNYYALGRNTDIWGQDAAELRPERFMGEKEHVVTSLNRDTSPGGLQHCVNNKGSKFPQLSTRSSDAQSSDMLSHDYTAGYSMLSGFSSILSGLGGKKKGTLSASNNCK